MLIDAKLHLELSDKGGKHPSDFQQTFSARLTEGKGGGAGGLPSMAAISCAIGDGARLCQIRKRASNGSRSGCLTRASMI